jgi:hypothetical protein
MVEQLGGGAPTEHFTSESRIGPTDQPTPTTRFPAVAEMARRLSDAYPTDADRIARVKDNLLRSLGQDPRPVPENGQGDRS